MRDAVAKHLNRHVVERADAYADAFQSARPFRHVAIDDFFETDLLQSLLDSFPPFDRDHAMSENGWVGGKAVHSEVRELGPSWVRLDDLVRGDDFRSLIGRITGIDGLAYDPHYFGGGTHENRETQGLAAHIDFNIHPFTRQHRRLNLIVYLNPEWDADWGGAIHLHRDPYAAPSQDEITVIQPVLNRCVIFETNEHSWHSFPRISLPEDRKGLSRKSFALYYYTDERPEDETGPEHSTIYVDEHMPEDLVPGTVLDADRLQHLHDLVNTRDAHVRRLYDDIKRITAERNESVDWAQRVESEFRSSTSWRLTRPLRAVKRLLRGKDERDGG